MANTAFDHASALTIPGSTTNNGLVRWGDTSGTSFGNITGITSDGSNITLLTRGEIRFSDADSTHFIALESPATVSTSYTMTLPAAVPSAADYLKVTSYSGGAGVLEWATAGGARTVSPTNIDNALITFVDSGDTFTAEANLTFDGTNLTVGTGNVIIGTAGKGIDFSATANSSGSMSSELLDWYEEGTFTPTLADNDLNSSESQTYHTQTGRYVRIGRMVHCQLIMHTSGIGNLTTSHGVKILGLPFASLSFGATVGGGAVYIATNMTMTAGTSITVDVPTNASYCRLQNYDISGGTSTFLLSDWGSGSFASGGNILLSLSYEAA